MAGPPPPPPRSCAVALPPLMGVGRGLASSDGLQRAASDGGQLGSALGFAGGLTPPWGLPRVKMDVADGGSGGAHRSLSWEAAPPGGAVDAASTAGGWAAARSVVPGLAPMVGAPVACTLGTSTPKMRHATTPLPSNADVGTPTGPFSQQQLQSPRPFRAAGTYPPSPSDRFLVRPRSPASSSSSSSSSYAGIDMGHHRRAPLPASSFVPPPATANGTLLLHARSSTLPSALAPAVVAPHTTSTGHALPSLHAITPGRTLFSSLPLPPLASLRSWPGAATAGLPPLSPPLPVGAGGVSPPLADGSRRPPPPKLPPFSSLLSGAARAAPSSGGLGTAASPMATQASCRVTAWQAASAPGDGSAALVPSSATVPVAAAASAGAWMRGPAREPAPPPRYAPPSATMRH